MEFRLDDAQIALQDTVTRFCAERFPLDGIAAREGAPTNRGHWNEMAELGIFGLLLPEEAGGSGLRAVEAALVFEVLGSYLVPGPLLWMLLAAPLVDGVVTGGQLVGGVEERDIVEHAAVVEHAGEIDALLVVGDDSVRVLQRADVSVDALDPLDPLTTIGRVRGLDGGDMVGGTATASELRRLGTVLSAALAVGVAARALDVARAYALERQQFGVPIGSFQAVKHLLADMYVRLGLAQSSTYAAAALFQEGAAGERERAAASAKLLATEAAIENASTAVQVLGGMGFTWAMLPNYLLKRAWVLDQTFGPGDRLAADIGTTLVAGSR